MKSIPSWMQRLNIEMTLNEVNEEDIILDIPAEDFDEDEDTVVEKQVTMHELVYG